MARIQPIAPLAKQPRHAAAVAKISELSSALVKVEGRIHEIEVQMQSHVTEKDRSKRHVDAALEFASSGILNAPQKPAHLTEEHLVLREQAEALRGAISDRTRELRAIEGELSRQAFAAIKPQHDELCVRYGRKLRELDALHVEEANMQATLSKLGYSDGLPRYVQWLELGRIDDVQSLMAARAREFPV